MRFCGMKSLKGCTVCHVFEQKLPNGQTYRKFSKKTVLKTKLFVLHCPFFQSSFIQRWSDDIFMSFPPCVCVTYLQKLVYKDINYFTFLLQICWSCSLFRQILLKREKQARTNKSLDDVKSDFRLKTRVSDGEKNCKNQWNSDKWL